MLGRHNSMKRGLAGLIGMLALLIAASGPLGVAASNGSTAPVTNVLASLESATWGAVDSSLEIARDLRSIYSLYQLQTAPEIIPLAETTMRNMETVPRVILCDVFQNAKPADAKKKSRI